MDAMVKPWHDEGGGGALFSGRVLIIHAGGLWGLLAASDVGKDRIFVPQPFDFRHAMA
ncbi:hypothetical protein V6L77_05875 [Pannonibacter sp. Pt2-lr]